MYRWHVEDKQACTGATGNTCVGPIAHSQMVKQVPVPDATKDLNTCKNLTGNTYKAGDPATCTNSGDNLQIACEEKDNDNAFVAASCSNGGDASSEGACKVTGYIYTAVLVQSQMAQKAQLRTPQQTISLVKV